MRDNILDTEELTTTDLRELQTKEVRLENRMLVTRIMLLAIVLLAFINHDFSAVVGRHLEVILLYIVTPIIIAIVMKYEPRSIIVYPIVLLAYFILNLDTYMSGVVTSMTAVVILMIVAGVFILIFVMDIVRAFRLANIRRKIVEQGGTPLYKTRWY